MKGIVFTEFLEMIEEQQSPDHVDELIETAGLPHAGAFTAVGTYPHTEMVALVVRHAEMTGESVPAVLQGFGRYLFGRFVQLYPVFFEGIEDPKILLAGIEDVIHVEVRKLYPDAELPRFEARWPEPETLELIYRSERHLADLAEGLIHGCVSHFGKPHRVLRGEPREDGSVAFLIQPGS
jgi:hypothetical protein